MLKLIIEIIFYYLSKNFEKNLFKEEFKSKNLFNQNKDYFIKILIS
jgi:hypothetical protein